MKIWFHGSIRLSATMQQVNKSLVDINTHFLKIAKLMPGLVSVTFEENEKDFVKIRSNRGLQKRYNVHKDFSDTITTLTFDEVYNTSINKGTTTKYTLIFSQDGETSSLDLTMYDVTSTGFRGLVYRLFRKKLLETQY